MSLNLQEALNAGSGINLRGQVGNYMETLTNQLTYHVLANPTFVIDGTPTDIENSVAVETLINGQFAPLAINTDATMTGDNVPDGSSGMWYVTWSGSLNTVQAFIVDSADYNVTLNAYFEDNAAPPGVAVVCIVKVANASGSDFIPGTTALNAASITTSFNNLGAWAMAAPSQNIVGG